MAQTLKERTQNYVPFSILGKLFTWIRYLYVGGDLEVIPVTGNKLIMADVVGLFADCCTGYIRAIIVSDTDCVISDQDRV